MSLYTAASCDPVSWHVLLQWNTYYPLSDLHYVLQLTVLDEKSKLISGLFNKNK